MPLYRYEALDRTGSKVVGAMDVDSESTLAARLGQMGYRPTMVQIAQRTLTAAPLPTPRPQPTAAESPLRASDRDVARMLHQLHLAFRSGMPALQSLSTVATQTHSAPLRTALLGVEEGVRQGMTLSGSMERFPRIFGPGDVGMIRAAEMGGFLPEALQAMASRREEDENARGRMRIWVWFLHSNVLSLFLFIPVGWFLKDVFPSFDVKVGLAAAARSTLLLTLPLSAAYIAFLIWLGKVRESPAQRRFWHGMVLRLPIVAKLNQLRAKASFTRSLAWLVHAGVGPATAWETAARSVPNLVLAERFAQGTPVVESTGKPSNAIIATGLLDPSDAGMVATGETTGEIPQALGYLANRYEEEARQALQESVAKAATMFRGWAFMLGALAFALVMWGYMQGAVKIITDE